MSCKPKLFVVTKREQLHRAARTISLWRMATIATSAEAAIEKCKPEDAEPDKPGVWSADCSRTILDLQVLYTRPTPAEVKDRDERIARTNARMAAKKAAR